MTLPGSFSVMAWLKFDEFLQNSIMVVKPVIIPTILFSFESSQIMELMVEGMDELVKIDLDSTIVYKDSVDQKISDGWNQITFTYDRDENKGIFI